MQPIYNRFHIISFPGRNMTERLLWRMLGVKEVWKRETVCVYECMCVCKRASRKIKSTAVFPEWNERLTLLNRQSCKGYSNSLIACSILMIFIRKCRCENSSKPPRTMWATGYKKTGGISGPMSFYTPLLWATSVI